MLNLDIINTKILSGVAIDRQLTVWRFKTERIVLTNGCFDILHLGHIHYLAKAADLGDVLIVGLNTDNSVRRIKGGNRPVNAQQARAQVLASLHFVDAVVLFDEDTPYNLIRQIQPDVLVKGGDYKLSDIVGYDIVTAKGGSVVTIDYLAGYSTTSMLEKIKTI